MPYDNIKSHKKQGFAPSIENTVLQKPKRVGSNWPFCIFSNWYCELSFTYQEFSNELDFWGCLRQKMVMATNFGPPCRPNKNELEHFRYPLETSSLSLVRSTKDCFPATFRAGAYPCQDFEHVKKVIFRNILKFSWRYNLYYGFWSKFFHHANLQIYYNKS